MATGEPHCPNCGAELTVGVRLPHPCYYSPVTANMTVALTNEGKVKLDEVEKALREALEAIVAARRILT